MYTSKTHTKIIVVRTTIVGFQFKKKHIQIYETISHARIVEIQQKLVEQELNYDLVLLKRRRWSYIVYSGRISILNKNSKLLDDSC